MVTTNDLTLMEADLIADYRKLVKHGFGQLVVSVQNGKADRCHVQYAKDPERLRELQRIPLTRIPLTGTVG